MQEYTFAKINLLFRELIHTEITKKNSIVGD